MNQLLANVLDAHGGLSRGFLALKGMLQDSTPRRMSVWLHEERSSVLPFGAPDQRTMFTPDRIAIEKLDGTVVAERHAPKDSFAGHQMSTPWDPLQRAYFNGEAVWTFLTTPFLLAGWGTSGGNRTLAGRSSDMARTARLFPKLNRDAQPHTGLFLWKERLHASPPRLQREHCGRFSSSAADFELCDSKRNSVPN